MRTFWSNMIDALKGNEGFSVIFYLKSGARLNLSISSPGFTAMGSISSTFIEGENIEADRQAVVIAVSAIEAYEIEY
jgi:hypothetical protein